MRTPTIIRLLVVALLAAGALAVAACGGDDTGGDTGGGNASAADREQEAREAAVNYARCMREHGVDVPDPTFEDGGGILQKGPTKEDNLPRSKVREAENACRKYMDDVEPPQLSDEQQQEFREAALANARCMREHGIENFPDPQFGENGEARIRIDKRDGIDPEDPDFKAAQEACRDTMKPPGEESAP